MLLVVAAGSVLLGTLYPLIIDALNLGKLSVGPPYFNTVFVPIMVPLLVLMYLVAAADGLTQRAIRRACGGRESASLYHRAKHLQVMLLAMGGVLVLIQPVSIDPRLIGVPVALLVGILARLQWACYKKHL